MEKLELSVQLELFGDDHYVKDSEAIVSIIPKTEGQWTCM